MNAPTSIKRSKEISNSVKKIWTLAYANISDEAKKKGLPEGEISRYQASKGNLFDSVKSFAKTTEPTIKVVTLKDKPDHLVLSDSWEEFEVNKISFILTRTPIKILKPSDTLIYTNDSFPRLAKTNMTEELITYEKLINKPTYYVPSIFEKNSLSQNIILRYEKNNVLEISQKIHYPKLVSSGFERHKYLTEVYSNLYAKFHIDIFIKNSVQKQVLLQHQSIDFKGMKYLNFNDLKNLKSKQIIEFLRERANEQNFSAFQDIIKIDANLDPYPTVVDITTDFQGI